MGRVADTAVGVVAGMVVAGAIGVMVSNGKIKPRKVAKGAVKAMTAMGDVAGKMSTKCVK